MKKLIIISTVLVAMTTFFSSFVNVKTVKETAGKIQFAADAGSEQLFTVNDWAFTKVAVKKDDIENLHVELEMEMGSISCDWKDLEKSVKKKKDYFYVKGFPKATVTIDKAQKQADGTYTCQAMLTLKNVTKPVVLKFSVNDEGKLHIIGSGTVQRREFDFTGDGPKNEVGMTFDLMI
jgi:polyisoprenoid-binding protein YceI